MISFTSKHCGRIDLPWSIVSNTNIMTVRFKSDNSVTETGFLAVLSETTEPPTYPSPSSCDSCIFPFTLLTTVSCGQHSASNCSQCPYNGEAWIGEAWCNGDCSWINEECVLSRPSIQFHTCIRVEGIDDQPWCSPSEQFNFTQPVDGGTHIFPSLSNKVFCLDSDTSCPNTAPQELITSPDYPQSYPNNADQVCRR